MIDSFAKSVRAHLNYATVVSALTAFVVLFGGAAIAADQLVKNSVGTKQLKKNAVTTAKLKKNSVTNAKLKKEVVTGAKVKDGSLTGSAFKATGSAFSHIVFSTSSTTSVSVAAAPVVVPLGAASYAQLAGEDDFYYGSVDASFASTCEPDRQITVYLLVDSPDPVALSINDIVAFGSLEGDTPDGTVTRIGLGPFEANSVRFQPDADTPHTLTLVASGDCQSGSGATVSNPTVVVTGVR